MQINSKPFGGRSPFDSLTPIALLVAYPTGDYYSLRLAIFKITVMLRNVEYNMLGVFWIRDKGLKCLIKKNYNRYIYKS